jgi:hypothetical protein
MPFRTKDNTRWGLTLLDLSREKPNVMWPPNPPREDLERHEYDIYLETPKPDEPGKVAIEVAPVRNTRSGFWEQRWELRDAPPDPPPTEAEVRNDAIRTDPDNVAMIERLRSATPDQIRAYVNTNVTDMASAKAMMARILVLLSRLV